MENSTTRRETLVRSAIFRTAGSAMTEGRAAQANDSAPSASHDPSYCEIPTREHLIRGLSTTALRAQAKPRLVNGISITGLPTSLLEIDRQITGIMRASPVPGVALAVAKGKWPVLTRGYGTATLNGHVAVEPTTVGGWMSVTKTLTVAAALALVRDWKLHFEERACSILTEPPLLASGETADPRRAAITVRELMSHTAGLFNTIERLNDPGRFSEMARRKEIQLVHDMITQEDVVRIGWKEPLLFDPGTKFAYSGQGMQVLARVVEHRNGQRLDK
jgi:CubicO group peptidase (beta-lactamase class C family)